jgi:Ca2+-binding RTX toxin-like protein
MTGTWNGTSYVGDDSNDVATGTDAANAMFGNKGDDNLNGAGGNDDINGGVGSDNLNGGAGDDTLWDFTGAPFDFSGVIGHDTLRGGDGDDHLNVWSPDTGDVADGGAGFDTLEVRFNYETASETYAVSFVLGRAPSVAQVDGINTVAVSQMENMLFVSNDGNDFITGGEYNDTISGQGGNDVIDGGAGDDLLEGGTGIQDIQGGKGFDRASFDLSEATDGLTVVSGRTISLGAWGSVKNVEELTEFHTGSGNDVVKVDQAEGTYVYLNGGADRFIGGDGGDGVEAGAGDDRVDTGGGADFVDPGAGADIVHLGAGNDGLDYTETGTRSIVDPDQVYGEDGDDDIYTGAGADLLDGGIGNDVLYAGAGADTVVGGGGNDEIEGERGADRLDGGEGDDVIGADYDYWTDQVWADNDRVAGGGGNDRLEGGLGRDLLDGGLGDDIVTLSVSNDDGDLDTGLDEAMGGDGTDLLTIYGPSGTDATAFKVGLAPDMTIKADGKAIAHATSFERVSFNVNNAGDHQVAGGELNDSVAAGGGDGVFKLLGGADTLYSGSGSDTVLMGAGADTVTGFVGGADYFDLGTKDDSLVLYDYLSGSDLTAGIGGAVYKGGNGNDKLELWLTNAPGVTFDGENIRYNGTIIGTVEGFEQIRFNGTAFGTYQGSAAADYISLTAGSNAANGNDGADTIVAVAGADTLNGGAGDDQITGGGGADRLTGAAGADTFIYTALSQSGGAAIDTITDFGAGDRIDLSLIDADTLGFGNQAFHLGGGGGHAGDMVLTYDAGANRTALDLYVNNDAVIDATIWLTGDKTALTIGDFVP